MVTAEQPSPFSNTYNGLYIMDEITLGALILLAILSFLLVGIARGALDLLKEDRDKKGKM